MAPRYRFASVWSRTDRTWLSSHPLSLSGMAVPRPITARWWLGIFLRQKHTLIARRGIMGKYFIGWLLGIPVVVLVIIYLIF